MAITLVEVVQLCVELVRRAEVAETRAKQAEEELEKLKEKDNG